MLRKTGPLGFLSGMLLAFFKCKESFGDVGVVVNNTQVEGLAWAYSFVNSFAINSACFNIVSVASFCISGG